MNSSTLLINGVHIDRAELLLFLKNNSKLYAIKRLREEAKIGLKESKEIIEALEINPDYQPNDDILTSAAIEFNETHFKNKQRKAKIGNHFIQPKSNNRKTILTIFILISIVTMMYFYFIK
nr:hypothetical protein [uncultured Psychroserpens sp.]